MDKHLLVAIPLAVLYLSCSSHKISKDKVPSVVLNTMNAKYLEAKQVQWEKHGSLYEAEIDLNDSLEITTKIDESGKLLMEKADVPVTELSREILSVLRRLYKDYTIDDAEKVLRNGKVYYQLELDGRGKKDTQLVLSPLGNSEKYTPYWD